MKSIMWRGILVAALAINGLCAAATGLDVSITNPANGLSTAQATITVSGTGSSTGSPIAAVKVNNVAASSGDGYLTWTVSIPLGFGTNRITATATDTDGNYTTTPAIYVACTTAQTFNPLMIPDTMSGTEFNLSLNPRTKQFFAGQQTNTNAYNDYVYGAPTLILKKGDTVQMHVKNNLPIDTTTTHWHGLHLPAIMDGGPHQTIPAGTTWSPYWEVMNEAATYWYHPHLHQKTQEQVSKGGVGMIIIQDDHEASLALPRTYGVDDIPLAMNSLRFQNNQIVTAGTSYGDFQLVNGTLNPQITLPKQFVRFRLLNCEVERTYNLGFSDNRTFYVIGTDGGLVNSPVAVTRLVVSVGERYEILVNLGGDSVGSTVDLKAYNSNASLGATLSNFFPGGEPQTNGPVGSLLNNLDYTILHINVGAATANAITQLPGALGNYTAWTAGQATNSRTINIVGGGGGNPFSFDNQVYSETLINQTVSLNAVERWTITNTSAFTHAFHIHDIQFSMISRVAVGGGPPVVTGIQSYEQGWKDTLYVQRGSSVTFITKFDHFASSVNPFMYHCHFTDHEDGGLMNQFLVVSLAGNSVADLFNLAISAGTLSPSFSYATTAYTDLVANSVSSVTVTPTVTDAGATVKVNGVAVASSIASNPISLSVGDNTINVVVMAADGATTKTYTIIVTRAGSVNADLAALVPSAGSLTPNFASNTLNYTDNVTNAVSSLTLTPTAVDLNASIKVNGTTVASGSPSAAINLDVGSNAIPVVVTASDSLTTKTYTVTVNRAASSNADLISLTPSTGVLSPGFTPGATSYAISVTNSISTLALTPTVSDAGAKIRINGTPVASGDACAAINLNVGSNTINVVVTAADNVTTKTYVVTVTRSDGTNADLSALTTSAGSVFPTFSNSVASYFVNVTNAITSITVTPTVSDSAAHVTVDGQAVTSGNASSAINLSVGESVIAVVVTAENGTATKTYTVTVTREASSNADLSALIPSVGALTPVFAGSTQSYSINVSSSTPSIALAPTVADGTATVKVNGQSVQSGQASSQISLVTGANTISVVVTAQNTTTTKTYLVTVTRAGASNADLAALVPSAGTLSPAFSSGTLSYTMNVSSITSSIAFTPTLADGAASVKINGSTVASGAASSAINLAAGNNTITIVVTAADNVTTQTYVVTVFRADPANADLISLTPSAGSLSPVFASGTLSYTDNVSNLTVSITLTPMVSDQNATVAVNGTPVTSGASSGSISLNFGSNLVNVVVTAADGTTTKTYTVIVNRANNTEPVFVSSVTATPYPGVALSAAQFTAVGADGDGDALSFAWDFGDGTTGTGATASHTYTTAAYYTVTVTVSDTIASATQTFRYPVVAAGAGTAVISKAAITFNFADASKSTMQLTGSLQVNSADYANKKVSLTLVALNREFTLDAKGKGTVNGDKNQALTLKLLKKGTTSGPAAFKIAMKSASTLFDELKSAGFTTETQKGTLVPVKPVLMQFDNGIPQTGSLTVTYTAKAGKTGVAKK